MDSRFSVREGSENQIHVLVPAQRSVRKEPPGLPVTVHYSTMLAWGDVHPLREPRRTRVARSLVDAAAWAGSDRRAQALLDAVWEAAGLTVEVDGIHHLDAAQYWADMDRDNDFTVEGYRILRFPAFVVRYRPGYVAGKIREALRGDGRRIESSA